MPSLVLSNSDYKKINEFFRLIQDSRVDIKEGVLNKKIKDIIKKILAGDLNISFRTADDPKESTFATQIISYICRIHMNIGSYSASPFNYEAYKETCRYFYMVLNNLASKGCIISSADISRAAINGDEKLLVFLFEKIAGRFKDQMLLRQEISDLVVGVDVEVYQDTKDRRVSPWYKDKVKKCQDILAKVKADPLLLVNNPSSLDAIVSKTEKYHAKEANIMELLEREDESLVDAKKVNEYLFSELLFKNYREIIQELQYLVSYNRRRISQGGPLQIESKVLMAIMLYNNDVNEEVRSFVGELAFQFLKSYKSKSQGDLKNFLDMIYTDNFLENIDNHKYLQIVSELLEVINRFYCDPEVNSDRLYCFNLLLNKSLAKLAGDYRGDQITDEHKDSCEKLIEKIVEMGGRMRGGNNSIDLLTQFCMSGNIAMIELIMSLSPKIYSESKNFPTNQKDLEIDNVKVVDDFLNRHRIHMREDGRTIMVNPLMAVISSKYFQGSISDMLENFYSLPFNFDRESSEQGALLKDRLKAVRLLIEKGAMPHYIDAKNGSNTLTHAIACDDFELAIYLVDQMKLLAEQGKVNSGDIDKFTNEEVDNFAYRPIIKYIKGDGLLLLNANAIDMLSRVVRNNYKHRDIRAIANYDKNLGAIMGYLIKREEGGGLSDSFMEILTGSINQSVISINVSEDVFRRLNGYLNDLLDHLYINDTGNMLIDEIESAHDHSAIEGVGDVINNSKDHSPLYLLCKRIKAISQNDNDPSYLLVKKLCENGARIFEFAKGGKMESQKCKEDSVRHVDRSSFEVLEDGGSRRMLLELANPKLSRGVLEIYLKSLEIKQRHIAKSEAVKEISYKPERPSGNARNASPSSAEKILTPPLSTMTL